MRVARRKCRSIEGSLSSWRRSRYGSLLKLFTHLVAATIPHYDAGRVRSTDWRKPRAACATTRKNRMTTCGSAAQPSTRTARTWTSWHPLMNHFPRNPIGERQRSDWRLSNGKVTALVRIKRKVPNCAKAQFRVVILRTSIFLVQSCSNTLFGWFNRYAEIA